MTMFYSINNDFHTPKNTFKVTTFERWSPRLFQCLFTLYLIHKVRSAPPDHGLMSPGALDSIPDASDLKPFVHKDDKDNVYFDVHVVRGEENRIMFAKNGVLVVSVGPSEDTRNTPEFSLWTFIGSILHLDLKDLEILLFPGEIGRRVLLRRGLMSDLECENRIKNHLKPYVPSPGSGPGGTEPPPLLHPFAPLAIYAQNDSQTAKKGPWKYFEVDTPVEVAQNQKTAKKTEKTFQKKLIEMKPFYERDPSLVARVLRDLAVKKEFVFRGRLLPGSPVKPILDDYRGPGKIKLVRRILEGIADANGTSIPTSKLRLDMSHPIPGPVLLDYRSPDGRNVISRRLINPLFKNATADFVEEFEYTEVV